MTPWAPPSSTRLIHCASWFGTRTSGVMPMPSAAAQIVAVEVHRHAFHQAARAWVERCAPVHGEPVVPQDQVPDLPLVSVNELVAGGVLVDLLQQGQTRRRVHVVDADGRRRIKVERAV